MRREGRTAVTVAGLGSFGATLVRKLTEAGYSTTVWDPMVAKVAALETDDVSAAANLESAVVASPLVITCMASHEDTFRALESVAAALAGRALVVLTAGSPAEAWRLAMWTICHGGRFLHGAIDELLRCAGDRTVVDDYADMLRLMAEGVVYLGSEPDLVALRERTVHRFMAAQVPETPSSVDSGLPFETS